MVQKWILIKVDKQMLLAQNILLNNLLIIKRMEEFQVQELQLVQFKMIVSSSYFKKQFDVSKAELIGQGNFAQVFRVFDAESQTYLAIRRVDRDLGQSQDIQKQKTINEQLRRVQNEHILKIFDIIQSTSCIWYITEYCQGGSLWDALNNCTDNKMNQKDTLEIVYQVSKGVKQLHNHRITHRDLKPENILLKTKYIPNKPIPTIKIADFGLSTKKIIMETIAGTKEYIAPEQARFHNYTNAVDVWSLGIIFDEILHGSPFYVGQNNKEVFQKILKNPYKVRDETIRPSIQEFLISVLKKKAYQRPIIAVICQNIEKIIEEIKRQRKQPEQHSHEKFMSFQKKNMKSMPFLIEQVKSPFINSSQPYTGRQVNVSLRDIVETQNKLISKFSDDKSQSKVEQRKAKTPFKRQNGRPELFKSTQETEPEVVVSSALSSIQRNPKTGLNTKKQAENKNIANNYSSVNMSSSNTISNVSMSTTYRQNSKQNPTKVEQTQKTQNSDIEKISVYRVDKRKVQNIPAKVIEINPVIVDIKDYTDSVIKMKSQLAQSSLTIVKQRQFIPNAQLTITDFPQKFEGEQIMNKFKKSYEYLNYVSFKQDYEAKLHIGKNTLNEQRSKAQKQMMEHKQKIKKCFLAQIDKYVDYYIQKTIK